MSTRGAGGQPPSVAIIGGGLCGLGIGWQLASRGWRVELYEADRIGAGASSVAAGMLAARLEYEPGEQALLALGMESQRRWPAFAAALQAAVGQEIGFRTEGSLLVALTRDDLRRAVQRIPPREAARLEISALSGAELAAREPMLRPGVAGGWYSRLDHLADSVRLLDALAGALVRAGGRIHAGVRVRGVRVRGGRACGVELGDGDFLAADFVVLAAGAWSGELEGVPPLPIRPVKGQTVTLSMDVSQPVVRHVCWVPGGYVAPHLDGRLILGATVEDQGFNAEPTAGAMLALLHMAWQAFPAIQELPIVAHRVGFRPGSPDDSPLLGPTELERLWVAAGHHRNGVLLLPVTAEGMGQALDEAAGRCDVEEGEDWLAAFSPGRFAGSGRERA